MAFADALPDPREWPRQLRGVGGTSLQDASAVILTVGSIAMTAIVVASAAIFFGLGTVFAESVLAYEVGIPFIGTAKLLPALAFAGGVIAVPYTLRVEAVAGDRDILMDDANWVIATSAATYILAAVQTGLSVGPTMRLAALLIGVAFGGLYVTRVVRNR